MAPRGERRPGLHFPAALGLCLSVLTPAWALAGGEDLVVLAGKFADMRDWDNAKCEGAAGTMNRAEADAITTAIGSHGADADFLRALETAMRDFDDDQAQTICQELIRGNPALFSALK